MRIRGRLVVAGCLLVVLAGCRSSPATTPERVSPSASVGAAARALSVLRGWDRARAAAWAAGDLPALRRLYADGSAAGRHDAAMLARWNARGLRVRGMAEQVLGVRVLEARPTRIVLVVTDRLLTAYAEGRGRRLRLPHDNASTRRIVLRRVEGRWVVLSVRVDQTSNCPASRRFLTSCRNRPAAAPSTRRWS